MLYNHLDVTIKKQIELDLYYNGLKDKAVVSQEEGDFKSITIEPNGILNLEIEIPANKWTWYVFK